MYPYIEVHVHVHATQCLLFSVFQCVHTAVRALHIQLTATGDFLEEDPLDVSPIQNFPRLEELWVFGVVA